MEIYVTPQPYDVIKRLIDTIPFIATLFSYYSSITFTKFQRRRACLREEICGYSRHGGFLAGSFSRGVQLRLLPAVPGRSEQGKSGPYLQVPGDQ